jgi:hypothetical protein
MGELRWIDLDVALRANAPPQMATCATPGTRSKRDRIFQYAMAERSVGLTVSEVRPIFMMRLVAESAGIMNGGLAQVGRVG